MNFNNTKIIYGSSKCMYLFKKKIIIISYLETYNYLVSNNPNVKPLE